MTIDLRDEVVAFRAYTCHLISEHIGAGKPTPKLIHFGFTFDQDGWLNAYFDTRPNASWDGEWTKHIAPETLLVRPHWHEASELEDLRNVTVIGVDGQKPAEWLAHPDLKTLASILGCFIRSSVASFIEEGVFRPMVGLGLLEYCVEEFTGLYCWPVAPETATFAELLRSQLTREERLSS